MRHPRFTFLLVTAAALLASGIFPGPGRADDRQPFARWEPAIAAFERQDQDKPPPQHAILFVGSSSIRRWNLAKNFPDLEVINRGFGGSELADSVHFVDRLVLKHKPRIVVLYAGDNDIAAGKTADRVFADFKDFYQAVHSALPKTKILFLSIKPSLLRWKRVDVIRQANALIENYCQKHDGLVYIDVFKPMLGADGKPRPDLLAKDGLHPNDECYRLWASLLMPYLK